MHKFRKLMLLVTLALGPGVGHASHGDQQLAALSEEDYLQSLPIVLSGSRLAQPLSDSPVSITIIDREMIEASGVRSLPEIFRLVPGFLVGYDNGHIPVVSYHLLNEQYSRRMQVLIDGRSVYTPTFGGVPWNDLPLSIDDIERIEVIRGPNAASYGANSFLGVINITTREASLSGGTRLQANVGEDNIRDGFLRHGGALGPLNYRFTVGYRHDDGFDSRYDNKYIHLLDTRADYQLNTRDRILFKAGVSDNSYQVDTIFSSTTFPPHDRQTNTSYQQLKWTRTYATDSSLNIQLYHNFHKVGDNVITGPVAMLGGIQLPIDYSYKSERYDLEAQNSMPLNTRTRLVWGGSIRQDLVSSQAYFGQSSPLSVWTHRLFAHSEWRPDVKLVVNAGAMLEDNDITGSDISPLFTLNYHISRQDTLRLSYSRATRTPVLLEDKAYQYNAYGPYFDIALYGPGNLRAERISAYELGYVGLYPEKGLQLDIKFYYDELRDLIAYEDKPYPDNFDGYANQFANYDDVRMSGLEAGVQYKPGPLSRFIFAYSYTDITASDRTRQTQYTHSAPLHNLAMLAIRQLPRHYTASIAYYYTGSMQGWDTTKMRSPMRKLDVQLSKKFRDGALRGQIALIAQNVLEDYQEIKLSNIARRTLYLRLKLDLL